MISTEVSTSAENFKVAVIGGGIFGCTIALSLAEAGYSVTLFERKPEILSGASKNNQNRLHLGYHYPRNLETARQCQKGFGRFLEKFPECIVRGFPNNYFIVKSGSLTSPEDYLKFCQAAQLSYQVLDLNNFSQVQGCELGITSDEVVYDCALLKSVIFQKIKTNPRIDLRTGTEVSRIIRKEKKYEINSSEFEAVINCSYDEINRLTADLGFPIPERQFEYTVVPIIELDIPRQGITIMDGPFMTLLPHGSSKNFLLYHVAHTVIETSIGTTRDHSWSDPETSPFSKIDSEIFFKKMKEACSEFVPALKSARLVGFLQGPRMILARRDKDDARPSMVQNYGDGYMTIFSGKIDHCIPVSEEVRDALNNFFKSQNAASRE